MFGAYLNPKRHDLKTWPVPFQAVWERRKTAEFRKADRDFQVGHELLLREYDPEAPETCSYSGRQVLVKVTCLTMGSEFGIPKGYAMLSFQALWRGGDDQMVAADQ